MGKAKAKGKHRLDKFYRLAKEQGWRSRAAFKLVQLDRKYRFLNTAQSLVDLCAAPGGWMQIAVKNMPVGSTIIGVDLVPIKPVRGALTLQEDITTPKCTSAIIKLLKQRGQTLVDVVLHDGSPNVGGAWAKEATTQASLVLDALKLATKVLAPKGTFVTKVFRSQDYTSLIFAIKQLFEKVEITKPMASRQTSAEIYVIGLNYLAPGKIDPRLLDARHLFQEIAEPPKVVDVLGKTKQKRHRDGYDETNLTFTKDCAAADFVYSDKPLTLLGSITSISFNDPASANIRDHPLTTDEIKALCEDLRVLGKKEFKQLLKWCLNVRKELTASKEEEDAGKAEEEPGEGDDEDGDGNLLAKMEELKNFMDSKKKSAKKKAAKRKQKTKARTATGMQVDVMEDQYGEINLFSLASIKAKKDLDRVDEAPDLDEETDKEDDSEKKAAGNEEDSDDDFDTARERYDAELEVYLDHAYTRYCKDKEGTAARRKRARMARARSEDQLGEDDADDDHPEKGDDDGDDMEEAANGEANPLILSERQPRLSKEQVARKWFSQDIFSGLENTAEADSADEDEIPLGEPVSDGKGAKKRGVKEQKTPKGDAGVTKATKEGKTPQRESGVTKAAPEDDFEVVPMEASDSSSDEDEEGDEEEYDSDAKAEVLAYAKKMLRKKNRDRLIDDAYNKHMFDDEGLPEWFVDDEKKHCEIIKPYTKEELEAIQQQFRAIDARPVKKVAEAKARKKRRTMRRLEQARQKASSIAEQADLSARSKSRMMDSVYKKALAAPKKKREVVVAKKGVGARGGKGKVVVDRRMKKDARARGSGKPGCKGKGNKGPGPVKMKRSGSKGGSAGGKGRKAGGMKGGRGR